MNLIEVSIEGMRQLAKNDSAGEGIDEHWEAVLPETYDIMANEIFLALYGRFINEPMRRQAAQAARNLPLRDVNDINDAKLYLHCLVRGTWLGIADDPEFQAYVDSNVNGVIHTAHGIILEPQRIGWAKSSLLWLPLSEEDFVRIVGALAERFRQYLFSEHCWHELTSRHVGKEVDKDMFALLTDSEIVTQKHRDEAYQRLSELSSKATNGLAGIDPHDILHVWWEILKNRSPHVQIQKLGVTPKAFHDLGIDMQRKGGKHEHVSLEEREKLTDTIPDESLKSPIKELMDNEFPQRFSANRHKIEEILSRESPKKRRAKIGKRRFKVMEMLTQTPTPTPAEIARQLQSSDQTIARDIAVIQQSWDLIQEVIHS